MVSTVLKLLYAAVMVQTGLTSSLTQNPKSQPKSTGLQKSSGENLLAFATVILCRLMAGKLTYRGSFRVFKLPGVQEGMLSPSYGHNRLIKLDFTFLEFICMLRQWANNTKEV